MADLVLAAVAYAALIGATIAAAAVVTIRSDAYAGRHRRGWWPW